MPVHKGIIDNKDYKGNIHLLEELLPFCSKNGISSERVGGASGFLDVSSLIFHYYLKQQGMVPKIKCAIIFIGVSSRNKVGFQVIYISPYHKKEFKTCFYAPP